MLHAGADVDMVAVVAATTDGAVVRVRLGEDPWILLRGHVFAKKRASETVQGGARVMGAAR